MPNKLRCFAGIVAGIGLGVSLVGSNVVGAAINAALAVYWISVIEG